jgi:hypothetical protein
VKKATIGIIIGIVSVIAIAYLLLKKKVTDVTGTTSTTGISGFLNKVLGNTDKTASTAITTKVTGSGTGTTAFTSVVLGDINIDDEINKKNFPNNSYKLVTTIVKPSVHTRIYQGKTYIGYERDTSKDFQAVFVQINDKVYSLNGSLLSDGANKLIKVEGQESPVALKIGDKLKVQILYSGDYTTFELSPISDEYVVQEGSIGSYW